MAVLASKGTASVTLAIGETLNVLAGGQGVAVLKGGASKGQSVELGASVRKIGPFSFEMPITINSQNGAITYNIAPSMADVVVSTLAELASTPIHSVIVGGTALVGPDAHGQYAEWYSNGVRWRPRSGIIAMKNTAGSVTDAGASEQDAYSVIIPAGLIGPNDDWYIDHFWQWPNSATNKTVRVKFGGTSIASLMATTTATGRGTSHIYMRDSKTAQIFSNASSALSFQEGQTSGTAPTTATIDTSSDITINLTGQWGTAGAGSNLITLERVAVGIKFAY